MIVCDVNGCGKRGTVNLIMSSIADTQVQKACHLCMEHTKSIAIFMAEGSTEEKPQPTGEGKRLYKQYLEESSGLLKSVRVPVFSEKMEQERRDLSAPGTTVIQTLAEQIAQAEISFNEAAKHAMNNTSDAVARQIAMNCHIHLEHLRQRQRDEEVIASAMKEKVICICPKSHQIIYEDISQMKPLCPRCRVPWETVNGKNWAPEVPPPLEHGPERWLYTCEAGHQIMVYPNDVISPTCEVLPDGVANNPCGGAWISAHAVEEKV